MSSNCMYLTLLKEILGMIHDFLNRISLLTTFFPVFQAVASGKAVYLPIMEIHLLECI